MPTKHNQQVGLTLIEVLVTISLFAVLALVSLTVIVSLSRSQAQTIVSQETISGARAMMDEMTDTIRSSKAVVTTLPDGLCQDTCLALRQNDESIIIYQKVGEELWKKAEILGDANAAELTGDKLKVTTLSFSVNSVPYPPPPPSVNLNLVVEADFTSRTDLPQYDNQVKLQDTVTLRAY